MASKVIGRRGRDSMPVAAKTSDAAVQGTETKLQMPASSSNNSIEDQILNMYYDELQKYRKEETEKDLAEMRKIESTRVVSH